jgi:hypothetical protein
MPSASAITGFDFPAASWMPTFICAGVAPLSRNTRAACAKACSRNSIVTAIRQLFRYVCGECVGWYEPICFERDNTIGCRNLHARRLAQISVRRADNTLQNFQDWRGKLVAHRHAPRKVARLARGDPQQMLGLLCVKDHFFAGGEDHLTAEQRGSRRSGKIWIFRPIAWTAA